MLRSAAWLGRGSGEITLRTDVEYFATRTVSSFGAQASRTYEFLAACSQPNVSHFPYSETTSVEDFGFFIAGSHWSFESSFLVFSRHQLCVVLNPYRRLGPRLWLSRQAVFTMASGILATRTALGASCARSGFERVSCCFISFCVHGCFRILRLLLEPRAATSASESLEFSEKLFCEAFCSDQLGSVGW